MAAVSQAIRGTQTIAAADGTVIDITIPSVDTSRSVVTLTYSQVGTSLSNARRHLWRWSFPNSTTLRLTRNEATSANNMTVAYNVVEFESGALESLQYYSQDCTADPTNIAITAVDTAHSFPTCFWSSNVSASSGAWNNAPSPTFEQTTVPGDTLRLDFNSAPTSEQYYCTGQVVEFKSTDADVQTGSISVSGASVYGGSATITAVDLAKTLVASFMRGGSSGGGRFMNRTYLSNTTTVQTDCQPFGTASSYSTRWYAIEMTDGSRVEAGTATISASSASPGTAPSWGSAMTDGVVFSAGPRGHGYITTAAEGVLTSARFYVSLDSPQDSLTIVRDNTAQDISLMWQAVEFADAGASATSTLTESDDTIVATLNTAHHFSAAITEADDTIVATVTLDVTDFSANITESNDTIVATIVPVPQASAAMTEADDTIAAFLSGAISITEIAQYRVANRSGSSRTITFSGTYSGTAPNHVQARIVAYVGGAEVVAWTTLSSPSIGSGAWTGNLSVPVGGHYLVEVRSRDVSNNVIAMDSGANRFGVGSIAALFGSSTAANWINHHDGPDSPVASRRDGGTWSLMGTTGAAATTYADEIIDTFGMPVGMLDCGVGGTNLSGQWDQDDYANYLGVVSSINQVGGVDYGIVHVGSNDARNDLVVSQAAHAAAYRQMISNLRTDVGDPTLPILIMGCQRAPGETNHQMWDDAREAEKEVSGDSNVYLASTAIDFSLEDIHLDAASYAVEALRVAQCVKYIEGLVTFYRGPRISSMVWNGNTKVFVNIEHRGGTDITPSTGITGFTASHSGGALTISSAVRASASQIELTFSTTPNEAPVVKYLSGANPTVTNPVKDNSSLTLPLEYETLMSVGIAEVSAAITEANDTIVAVMTVGTGDVITLNDIEPHSKFKRVAGFGTVPVSGTFSGTTPDQIRYRILKEVDSTQVVAFTNLGATIGSGTWSGNMTVPEGPDLYVVEVESRLSGVTLDTDSGTSPWGVGEMVGLGGSSSLKLLFSDGTVASPNAGVSYYRNGEWEAAGEVGEGAHNIGEQLATELGVVVGIVDIADGGTYMYEWSNDGTPYNNAIAVINAVGGLNQLAVAVGLNDGQEFIIPSKLYHKNSITRLISNFRADIGAVPYHIVGSQRSAEPEYTSTADLLAKFNANMDRVHQAEIESEDLPSEIYLAAIRIDQTLSSDLQHTQADGSADTGDRVANSILVHYGARTHRRGPFIGSVTAHTDPNRVRVFITLRGGSTVSPANVVSGGGYTAGELTGFEAWDQDGQLEITAVDRLTSGGLHDRLNFARNYVATNLPGGLPLVFYQRGGKPGPIYPDSYTDRVRDNLSGLNLPLEPRKLQKDTVPQHYYSMMRAA